MTGAVEEVAKGSVEEVATGGAGEVATVDSDDVFVVTLGATLQESKEGLKLATRWPISLTLSFVDWRLN